MAMGSDELLKRLQEWAEGQTEPVSRTQVIAFLDANAKGDLLAWSDAHHALEKALWTVVEPGKDTVITDWVSAAIVEHAKMMKRREEEANEAIPF